ncbi:YeeE/YedE thiosulfate transporter family protein [Acetobacterium sp.]|uniref:YeeE/YedE thiosulfate transporter family protein n=1 Tax=Acetobacterium sp. TaxID=1872094 RepID=UPI0035941158
MNGKDQEKFRKWFKPSWSYVIGAVLLSILQVVTLVVTQEPLGITSAFSFWAMRLQGVLGLGMPGHVEMVTQLLGARETLWFEDNLVTLRNLGIILGALLSALLASQFRLKKIKSGQQVLAAALGGLLMGYGSSIAAGCNIGAFFSGIGSMSLSGWVFGFFLFVGALIGGKLLLRFLI